MTHISQTIQRIFDKALSLIPLNSEELLALLALNPHGYEASLLRSIAHSISRDRFGEQAMLLCQTGVESFPCTGECAFCNFSKHVYAEQPYRMSLEKLNAINQGILKEQGVYSHFLLFMHTFSFEYVLQTVEASKKILGNSTDIVVNLGDFDAVQAQELKAAGVSGAYHVVRLGEGIDTSLNVTDRIRSIEAIKKAGIDWYTCLEPIGPEHSNDELLERILLMAQYDCFQAAVMRRVPILGTPLAHNGQIDLLRSAQIVAVVTLAMIQNKSLAAIAIHEPDLLGLSSGANSLYAEFGVNPRDMAADTTASRGHSIQDCKNMFTDVGLNTLMQANNKTASFVSAQQNNSCQKSCKI